MSNRIRTFVIMLLVVMAAGVIWSVFKPKSSGEIRNVVLISIDTCRADHLSCYGYSRKTTPNIDAVAKKGVLFENVVTTVPITVPAHSSMLTGTIPPYHGVHDNVGYKLAKFNMTLAEILKNAGFVTAAVVGAFVLDSQYGFDQGFDTYNDRFEEMLEHFGSGIDERRGKEVSRFACKWLSENRDEQFFLFLHYFDPHGLYDPPEPFASKFLNHPYAGEIAYADHCIGQVIKKLKELGIYDSTLLVITADHGEMLGEHGESTHSYFVYQGAIKVPLIFKVPGLHKSRRIRSLVGLIDIVPTICRLVGVVPPPHIGGEDLSDRFFWKQHLSGHQRYMYCESLEATKYGANSLLSVITDGWKYIQTTRPELYNLQKDPQEMNNLIDEQPRRARILQDRLKEILKETLERQIDKEGSQSKLELDEESRERLESLGYISSGSVTEDFEFSQSKKDPKDLIEFHKSRQNIQSLVFQERYTEAKYACEQLLVKQPDFFESYLLMARIFLHEGDSDGAISYLYRVLEFDPDNYKARFVFGEALQSQGKLDEAIKHYHKAVQIRPSESEAHNALGNVLQVQGKLEQAIDQYHQALELNPDSVGAHNNLGSALSLQGDLNEAISYFRRSLQLTPNFIAHYNVGIAYAQQGRYEDAARHLREGLLFKANEPKAHIVLADSLFHLGRIDEAITHWQEALSLEPDNVKVHVSLARALTRRGRGEEAVVYWQEALRLNPNQPMAYNVLAELLYAQGQIAEAIRNWEQALTIRSDLPRALNNLAWVYAADKDSQFHKPPEAVKLAEKACGLTDFKQPKFLDTLSVAYASVGRLDEAIETAQKAISLAEAADKQDLAEEIKGHLASYENGRF